jgi:hypothetical protein
MKNEKLIKNKDKNKNKTSEIKVLKETKITLS